MAKGQAQASVKFRTVEREEYDPERVEQGMKAWAAFLGRAVQGKVVIDNARTTETPSLDRW